MTDVSPIEPYLSDGPWMPRFVRGFKGPFRGLRVLSVQSSLWPWVVVPILLTSLLMALALYTTLEVSPRLGQALWPMAQGGVSVGRRIAHQLFDTFLMVAMFGLTAVAAWFTGMILASPFYDRLSEAVERLHDAPPARTTTTWELIVGDVAVGMAHSFANFALYAALSCPLLLLPLIPFVGEVLSPLAGTLLSSWLVAIEVLDFSLARRRYGWWQKLRWLWAHRATMLGLGFGSWVLLLVPLGGFVAMPAAVIAATELFVAMQRADALPD